MEREEIIKEIARALSNSLIKFDVFNYKGLACTITYVVCTMDRLSEKELNTKSGAFSKMVCDMIGEVCNAASDKPASRPSTEHPAIDEEVIALVGENKMISFAHIVDKNKAIDYDGWNIPNVKCWIPCPKIDSMS